MNKLHLAVVLAFALSASCLAPIDLLQQSGIQQTNDNREENDDLDPYDVNEKLMDEGVILDDTENNGHLRDGDIMFLPGQRERYFEPPQNYNSTEDDNDNDDDDEEEEKEKDNDQPQNNQLQRSKKDTEDENNEELLEDGERQEEEVPNIRDMNQREKLRLLEELENEIHSEHEDLEQENEVLKSSSSRWPVPIPYFLESSLSSDDKSAIKSAMSRLAVLTGNCVSFTPRSSSSQQHLSFFSGSGCWSYIGRTKQTEQRISIGRGCGSNRIIMHEIMHALGFYHEQSRTDRDKFVTILYANIETDKEGNFAKANPRLVTDFGVPYDYQSIMHYRRTAFSKNGRPTIISKDPRVTRFGDGKNGETTGSDIAQIRAAYCKPVKPPATRRRRRRRRRRWWGKK